MLSVLHTLLLLHFTNLWSSALRTSHTTIASLHQSVKQCSPYFTHCYSFTSPICEAVLSVLHTLLLLHFTNLWSSAVLSPICTSHTLLLLHFTNLWSSALRTSHTAIASLHQSVKQCSPYFTHCYCFTSPICEAVLPVLHTLLLLHFTNLWSSAPRTSHTAIASLHQSVKQCSPYFTHCYCFTSPICEAVLSVLHTLLLLHFTNLWSSALYFTHYYCFTSPICEAVKCFTTLSSCTVSLGPVQQSMFRIYTWCSIKFPNWCLPYHPNRRYDQSHPLKVRRSGWPFALRF